MAQMVEAVILSGPREGEIIHVPEETVEEWTEEETKLLNQALDEVIAALDRLSMAYRESIEALQPK